MILYLLHARRGYDRGHKNNIKTIIKLAKKYKDKIFMFSVHQNPKIKKSFITNDQN